MADTASLFQQREPGGADGGAPLAARMRPQNLGEFVGQDAIVGDGTVLRKAIESDQITSMLLCGPAGCGKTSLAEIIARRTGAHFEHMSAVTSGVADIRRAAEEARERRGFHDTKTILFIDEIHRLNKAQQDALLPHVERGVFVLIGATTENPYFYIVSPLVSRCRVFGMARLERRHIRTLLDRALRDEQRGLGRIPVEVEEAALDHLTEYAAGDARNALNALELAVLTAEPGPDGVRRVDLAAAQDAIQQKALSYDRAGDEHYDTISAFIKSMRGSDPDAAVYWLAKMIAAGEDPRFIARRILIQAAEDVGNADPMALVVAAAAAQAVEYVGLPEAQIPLAQATIYLATAEKSNASYTAISRALEDVKTRPVAPVPEHLRSGPRAGMTGRQDAEGYLYPHDYPGGYVPQEYVPPGGARRRYYEPTDRGHEKEIRARLAALERLRTGGEAGGGT